jgi:hypothetical protein
MGAIGPPPKGAVSSSAITSLVNPYPCFDQQVFDFFDIERSIGNIKRDKRWMLTPIQLRACISEQPQRAFTQVDRCRPAALLRDRPFLRPGRSRPACLRHRSSIECA